MYFNFLKSGTFVFEKVPMSTEKEKLKHKF